MFKALINFTCLHCKRKPRLLKEGLVTITLQRVPTKYAHKKMSEYKVSTVIPNVFVEYALLFGSNPSLSRIID